MNYCLSFYMLSTLYEQHFYSQIREFSKYESDNSKIR
jgi:hypothetical protein